LNARSSRITKSSLKASGMHARSQRTIVAVTRKPPRCSERSDIRPRSVSSERTLVAAASSSRKRCHIARLAGLRRGEVVGLRWEDVRFDTG
jgi:integrase